MGKLDLCSVRGCGAKVATGIALCDGDAYKCEKGHVLIVKIDEESFKVSLAPK